MQCRFVENGQSAFGVFHCEVLADFNTMLRYHPVTPKLNGTSEDGVAQNVS